MPDDRRELSRRDFFRRVGCLAGGGALAGMGLAAGCGSEKAAPTAGGAAAERAAFQGKEPYEATPILPVDAQRLRGVAVDGEGRIWVAAERGAIAFDEEGTATRALETPGPAHAVALDSEGAVFVALRSEVRKYSASGALEASWDGTARGRDGFRHIASLAVSGYNLYVGDPGRRRVLRYDITGDFIAEIGGPDREGDPGIVSPSMFLGVAAPSEDEVVFANHGRKRVEWRRPDGRLTRRWGRAGLDPEGFCGCCNPVHIAFAPGGRLVTVEKGIPRVKVYSSEGDLLSLMDVDTVRPVAPEGRTDWLSSECFGAAAVDARGRLLVLHPEGRWIWRFARKGAEVA